jgi:hypothetical protein
MDSLARLFDTLATNPAGHRHSTEFYRRSKASARPLIESLFASAERRDQEFGPFGKISLPYTRMGAVDSLDLFGLDELIIFAFYNANRGSYRNVIDIGANLGLHSIVLSRCGFSVKAFEPDAWHYGILSKNLAADRGRRLDAGRRGDIRARSGQHDRQPSRGFQGFLRGKRVLHRQDAGGAAPAGVGGFGEDRRRGP